jgi:hypothetical protein
MKRDAIYTALLNELSALTAVPLQTDPNIPPDFVRVVSRGFVTWDNADVQPAVYIVPVTEEAILKKGFPNKYLFKVDLYVYVRWTDAVATGVTALAQVMDAIDTILSPIGGNAGPHGDNGFTNTLGGLCQWCGLSGAAEISGGFLNKNQTVARMPIEIMVA